MKFFCGACGAGWLQDAEPWGSRSTERYFTEDAPGRQTPKTLECKNCGERVRVSLFPVSPNLAVRNAWLAKRTAGGS